MKYARAGKGNERTCKQQSKLELRKPKRQQQQNASNGKEKPAKAEEQQAASAKSAPESHRGSVHDSSKQQSLSFSRFASFYACLLTVLKGPLGILKDSIGNHWFSSEFLKIPKEHLGVPKGSHKNS